MDNIYFLNSDETEDQYIYRICSMKESSGMTWQQIADIINNSLGHNFGESAYRKKYQMFQNGLKACEKQIFSDDGYLKEIQKKTDEFVEAKKQFYDQRREYNRILTDNARANHIADEIIVAANRLNNIKSLKNDFDDVNFFTDGNCAVLCLSDWHYGMTTDNIWNKYNTEICKDRVCSLISKTKKYLLINKVNELHVILLGDMISGAIHCSCRVASEEDTCDQLMQVSEIIAEAIEILSCNVNKVYVHSTFGNHARTVQNKKDSIHSDNMEKVITFWLKQRLKENKKVIVNEDCNEFINLNVCGHEIVAVHGDLERFNSLGTDMHTLFNKVYGIDVEYVFSGDKHHNESNDYFGIDNVMVGSLCGVDEYANNKRLYSKPSQTLCIFNDEGKICTYNIIF